MEGAFLDRVSNLSYWTGCMLHTTYNISCQLILISRIDVSVTEISSRGPVPLFLTIFLDIAPRHLYAIFNILHTHSHFGVIRLSF